MDYLAEYRRYKQLYLELKATLSGSNEDRVAASESESSDISAQHQKLVKRHRKLISSDADKGDQLREKKMKKLRKIDQTLKKKGRAYVFFNGKPILAGEIEAELIKRLRNIAYHDSKTYHLQTVTTFQIKTIPQSVLNIHHGGVRLLVQVYRITVDPDRKTTKVEPIDRDHYSFRIFYNVDELERFSFKKLSEIAVAAAEKKFKNTMIGHYQYTEVEEILAAKD